MLSSLDLNDFFNFRGSKKKAKDIQLTEDEYTKLKEKSEKYDELLTKYKKLEEKNEIISALKKEQEKLKEKADLADKYFKNLARLQAEFDNYQKFSNRENQKFKKYALKNILFELLTLHDDLQRALNSLEEKKDFESLHHGLQMILTNLRKILENEGVKPIEAEGKIFDPSKHHVCMVERIKDNSDILEDTILEEIVKGYYYKDAILRPSMVKIAKFVGN